MNNLEERKALTRERDDREKETEMTILRGIVIMKRNAEKRLQNWGQNQK